MYPPPEDWPTWDDDALINRYGGRLGWSHLSRRLALERAQANLFEGFGTPFVHLENLVNLPGLLRLLLKVSGLYPRGRRTGCQPEVVDHPVYHRKIPRSLDGLRILHLSDIHADMSPANLHALIEAVRPLEYDLAVLTGDYRARTSGSWQAAADGMRALMQHVSGPVWAVLGNHDPLVMLPVLESLGVQVLMNEAATVEVAGGQLCFAGVDDAHYFCCADLYRTLAVADTECFTILLSHTPELYRDAAHLGFDYYLCGHTHGGQICLPGGIPVITEANCPRRLVSGPWQWGGMCGYTSRGTGMSILDVRFFCPPEIVIHELRYGMPP
ncbi:MAG: metallophosphoesterase [Gammaproteobacteria bacterium]|nr:MAG: metallophosphoesterase [Gammaproteobacteria bacterium]